MIVYLDQNVFVAILKDEHPQLRARIDEHRAVGTLFPYSPAHMEEVAVVLRDLAGDKLAATRIFDENMNVIAEISDHWEFLPGEVGQPTRFLQEPPVDCMKRVIDYYDVTLEMEQNERWLMSFKSSSAFEELQNEWGLDIKANEVEMFADKRSSLGIAPMEISSFTPSAVIKNSKFREGLRQKLWSYTYDLESVPKGQTLLDCHVTRQNIVNAVLKYLEEIGYRADKFENFRSRMHDVTHAIYGAGADYLVTGDKRFRARVIATYEFLELPTKVVSIEEFLLLDVSKPQVSTYPI
jgi:hypothetical protein